MPMANAEKSLEYIQVSFFWSKAEQTLSNLELWNLETKATFRGEA